MEFTVMKLKDLQESYSNYEPNTAFMQLKYNGTLQIQYVYHMMSYYIIIFFFKITHLFRCTLLTQYHMDKDNILNI